MGSREHERDCKGLLEHAGLNLTEYGPERSHGDPIREKRFCGRRPPQTRVQIIGEDSFWGEAIFRILANGEKPFALNIVKYGLSRAFDHAQEYQTTMPYTGGDKSCKTEPWRPDS